MKTGHAALSFKTANTLSMSSAVGADRPAMGRLMYRMPAALTTFSSARERPLPPRRSMTVFTPSRARL
jgi:hypothetical protein